MSDWIHHTSQLTTLLNSLSVTNHRGECIEPDAAFAAWRDLTLSLQEAGKTLYLVGNGASASMASHISTDLAKNAHVHTEVFTDMSLITALANDIGYDEVFAEPIRRRFTPGDMLVVISSSGQSPNVLKAAKEALSFQGTVITLSAMRADNPLRSLGILNIYVPADTYGMAETSHAAILHFWVDTITAKGRGKS